MGNSTGLLYMDLVLNLECQGTYRPEADDERPTASHWTPPPIRLQNSTLHDRHTCAVPTDPLAPLPTGPPVFVRRYPHHDRAPPSVGCPHFPTAQWCLSCVHAQTRFSCKKLRNNLADRPACSRKRRFRPQQFAQRNCVLFGLVSLHHPKRLAALSTAMAFPHTGRRFLALHKKLRHALLAEGAYLQSDHVAYAVGAYNLPAVSRP